MGVKSNNFGRTFNELFSEGKTNNWRRGDASLPVWIKRWADGDFCTITHASQLPQVDVFLSRAEATFAADKYNGYATGLDSQGNPKVILQWIDENDGFSKRGVMIIPNRDMAMLVVELVDKYCSDEGNGTLPAMVDHVARAGSRH